MTNIALLLSSILLAVQTGLSQCDQQDKNNVHYKNANLGEIPYQVYFWSNSQATCGGAIVNEKWMITAANCMQSTSATDVEVVTGTIDIKNPQNLSKVKKIVIHEKYDRDGLKNDIALVEVATPLVFSDTVKPVALPGDHTIVKANSTATISGYSAFSRDCQLLSNCDNLKYADFYINDQDECRKKFQGSWNISDTFICATDPFMIPNECGWGEPGGPLIVDEKLIGIMSWPFKGCDYYFPYVYTRISEYVKWINDHAK